MRNVFNVMATLGLIGYGAGLTPGAISVMGIDVSPQYLQEASPLSNLIMGISGLVYSSALICLSKKISSISTAMVMLSSLALLGTHLSLKNGVDLMDHTGLFLNNYMGL